MRENTALSAWQRDEQTIGLWLSLANTYSAEVMANLGFDWVCVDMQHGRAAYPHTPNRSPGLPSLPLSKCLPN